MTAAPPQPPVTSQAQQDWINRSTGPGVIWAHRFNDPSVIQRFTGASTPAIYADLQTHLRWNSTDGIIGDGCLEMFWPQNSTPQYGWGRPLFPIQASGLGPADINNAGLPVLSSAQYETGSLSSNNGKLFPDMFVNFQGGGYFVHPDYLIAANQPWAKPAGVPQPQILQGGDFWLQYRVKFSASRFSSLEATGKYLNLIGWHSNVSQEFVWQAVADFNGGWVKVYTNQGNSPASGSTDGSNGSLYDPQNQSGSAVFIEPGGRSACLVGDGGRVGLVANGGVEDCYCHHPDEWLTVMLHIIPGHQIVDTSSTWYTGTGNNGSRDTGLEMFAARPGQTEWTRVISKKNFIFLYGGDYIQGVNAQPYGWSWANFTPFNGGASPVPVQSPTGYYHRFDQIICSTQPIPLPRDFGAPAWFTAMQDKTWKQLALASDFTPVKQPAANVAGPVQDATIIQGAFCGSCVDQLRGDQLFIANGGHNGWSGNENYLFQVKTATPKWYRLNDRTPDNLFDYSQPSGHVKVSYLDGLPRAMHSWNVPVFAEGHGKIFYPYETDYEAPNSGNSDDGWMFDRDRCRDDYTAFPLPYSTVGANSGVGAGHWQYLGQLVGGNLNEGSEACWDPQNYVVIWVDKLPQTPAVSAAKTAFTINPTTLAITYYNIVPLSGNPTIYWAVCTRGLPNNVMVCGDYLSATDIYLWDLSNRSTSVLRRVVAVNNGSYTAQSGWYPVWHTPSKAFLFYDQSLMGGGSTIVKLAPSDPNNPLTTTWTFSNVPANVANTVTPPVTTNPSWSKFNIVRDMGNGQGCLIVTSWDQGVFAYKLPVAGV